MNDTFFNSLLYYVPALITGLVAYYFFKEHTKNEADRRKFILNKDLQVSVLPNRLQAYERLALFLERIAPNKLLLRVQPIGELTSDYESLLIKTIEQEFEHNLSQQIYMTDECWNVICTAKNATIQLIRKVAFNKETDNANKLRETILTKLIDQQTPSEAALAFLKNEISTSWSY